MGTDEQTLRRRIYSVDLLRGIVMMLMLLDHTRDFVHAGALHFDPTDLSRGDAPVFFTRWITHFCAPIFVFLSGVSIYLQKMNGKPNRELSWFLFTRGLWLVFLEFTLVRLGFTFNFDYSFFGAAQVIWAIGVSMMVMAALIYLPIKAVGAIGLAMILLHNLVDPTQVAPNIAFASQPPPSLGQAIWIILHQQGVIPLTAASSAFVAYPLIPWIGVMATGYWAGTIYTADERRRYRVLLLSGILITAAFFVLRATNLYGDPSPWKAQDTPIFTFLSILNTTKYPPSLLFLMMTLGPALIALAVTDRIKGRALWQRVPIYFGRVPMFFYLLQFPVAHMMGIVLSLAAGKDIAYFFLNIPQNIQMAPPDYGFSLATTYAAWIAGLILLYPLCVWWGRLKQRKRHWLLSYL